MRDNDHLYEAPDRHHAPVLRRPAPSRPTYEPADHPLIRRT